MYIDKYKETQFSNRQFDSWVDNIFLSKTPTELKMNDFKKMPILFVKTT